MVPGMFDDRQLILELLAGQPGWVFGRALVELSEGRLGRATVYVALDSLEDAGQVESRPDPNHDGIGLQRRQYRITNSGRGRLVADEAGGLVPA